MNLQSCKTPWTSIVRWTNQPIFVHILVVNFESQTMMLLWTMETTTPPKKKRHVAELQENDTSGTKKQKISNGGKVIYDFLENIFLLYFASTLQTWSNFKDWTTNQGQSRPMEEGAVGKRVKVFWDTMVLTFMFTINEDFKRMSSTKAQ